LQKFAEMKAASIYSDFCINFQVPGSKVGGDHIPTRRGGIRPSFALPNNQPASYEGAAATDVFSSPASTLSSGAVLIQALEAMGQEARQPTKSSE
jgi:hypothetical protein